MSDKPLIWRVVLVIVIVGVLVAAGVGIYYLGYQHGAVAARGREGLSLREFGHFGFFHVEDNDYLKPRGGDGGFYPDKDDDFSKKPFDKDFKGTDKDLYKKKLYYQQYPSKSKGYFSPLSTLLRFVVLGVLLWLAYKVITMFTRGKGWQLSFTTIEEGDEKSKKK